MITKITIENVKGFGIPGKEIILSLDPSKVNLCVAPNGFGKSSIAAAFESMNRNRLDIPEDKKHVAHKGESSRLSVTIDGVEYVADDNRNDVIQHIKPVVIHNRTQVDYTKQRFKTAFIVNAFMEISPIIVCTVVPPVKKDFYSIQAVRKVFGTNKKVLSSIENWLNNDSFCSRLNQLFPDLIKFEAKKRNAYVETVVEKINDLKGTEDQIRTAIKDDLFAELEGTPEYAHYLDVFGDLFVGLSKFEKFVVFYQLKYLWRYCKDHLRKLYARADYIIYKNRIDSNLKLLDSTSRNICTVERDNNLLVTFPHADEISNGQRDVLTFATELMIFRAMVRSDSKYILIIDEVFDYLDDANTMAAQYYLSNVLKENKGNIYIILLTHLNPFTFRNYVFNPKIINEVYLEEARPVASQDMMKFIAFRQWLEPKKHPERQDTYDHLSCDILHYNPNATDRSKEIAAYNQQGVKSTWGNPVLFRNILVGELNKYLSGQVDYDPYAVAIALRLRVEKIMYDDLATPELKKAFVKTHKTNDKLEFCETNNVPVPDAFFIVNSIHNEADHLKENPYTGRFEEKAMVYKLQNGVIHNFVKQLFNYKGHDLDVSVIS